MLGKTLGKAQLSEKHNLVKSTTQCIAQLGVEQAPRMAREWRVCNLKWRSPSAPLHNPKMKHTRFTSEENGQVRLVLLDTRI